eukprot:7666829-Pyramimonas_sp.AAC.1
MFQISFCPARALEQAQESPKAVQEAPKTTQEASKTAPRGAHRRGTRMDISSPRPQDAPRWPPGGSKRPTREAPRGSEDVTALPA